MVAHCKKDMRRGPLETIVQEDRDKNVGWIQTVTGYRYRAFDMMCNDPK